MNLRLMTCSLGIMLLALSLPASASEVDDTYYMGAGLGSAGWDYGYDDEDADEAQAKIAAEKEQRLEEEKLRKKEKANDFFSSDVDIFGKRISRTVNQDKKQKGYNLIKRSRN